jgi:hypothetical protein
MIPDAPNDDVIITIDTGFFYSAIMPAVDTPELIGF